MSRVRASSPAPFKQRALRLFFNAILRERGEPLTLRALTVRNRFAQRSVESRSILKENFKALQNKTLYD